MTPDEMFPTPKPKRDLAEELKLKGMTDALNHANGVNPGWGAGAEAFYRRHVNVRMKSGENTTTEEVRELAYAAGIPVPPDCRAWGHIAKALIKDGSLWRVGTSVHRNPAAHKGLGNLLQKP